MPRTWTVAALIFAGLLGSPGDGHAQSQKALEVCAKTALRQAMLLRQVTDQRDLRDRAGKVVGVELVMEVKSPGRQMRVYCVFDPAKNTASISTKAASAPAITPNDATEAVKACTKAGQQQALLIDTVVSQSDIKDAKARVTGRNVVLNVYQAGKAARLVCDYDYQSRTTALQLRRP